MKDKLRELAERWRYDDGQETLYVMGRRDGYHTCARELLALLDAEGDGGAAGGNEFIRVRARLEAEWCELQKLKDQYRHPARSGVVSDEDVDRVIASVSHVNTDGMDGDSWDRILVRAAIKGERHER